MSNNPLFDASYRRLFGDEISISDQGEAFFGEFYRRFLRAPGIDAFFRNTDMNRQVSMLRKSFFNLAGFYISCQPTAELDRIAAVHARLGISNEHYDAWLDTLVATVRELDDQCDPVTEMAWRWALTPGITYMKLFKRLVEAHTKTSEASDTT